MRKLSEYLQHADECRAMARAASAEHKKQFEEMAATWEQLAEARKRQLDRRGIAHDQDDGREV